VGVEQTWFLMVSFWFKLPTKEEFKFRGRERERLALQTNTFTAIIDVLSDEAIATPHIYS